MNVDIIPTKKAIKGVPVGGSVSIPQREAKILVMLGKAKYAANGYQTREMEAAPVVEFVEIAEVTAGFSPEGQLTQSAEEKPKRRYTRRVKTEE